MKNRKTTKVLGLLMVFATIFMISACSKENKVIDPLVEAAVVPQDGVGGWKLKKTQIWDVLCNNARKAIGSNQFYYNKQTTNAKTVSTLNGYGNVILMYSDDTYTPWASLKKEDGTWFTFKYSSDVVDKMSAGFNPPECPTEWTISVILKSGEKYERTFNLEK